MGNRESSSLAGLTGRAPVASSISGQFPARERLFGVEEELLLVHVDLAEPADVAELLLFEHERRQFPPSLALGQSDTCGQRGGGAAVEPELTLEIQEEQIEVATAPQRTLAEMETAIRQGRRVADAAAAEVGARAVAMGTFPGRVRPHLVPTPRYRVMQERFGLTAREQLTCGFHVHVEVTSDDEGAAALDRIRGWLPMLLALSANSPFWNGVDTGYSSYRYQAWSRWPTAGPTPVFGSGAQYRSRVQVLLNTGVPVDEGMVYFDARLSRSYPTLEVRIADVCLEPAHAAAVAALVRALVETASGQWRAGVGPCPVGMEELRLWSWQASMSGTDGTLVSALKGRPCPTGDAMSELLDFVRPALAARGEEEAVETAVAQILRSASGARRQREAYARRSDFGDVLRLAAELTNGA